MHYIMIGIESYICHKLYSIYVICMFFTYLKEWEGECSPNTYSDTRKTMKRKPAGTASYEHS